MTSYLAASERGRDAALVTNTTQRMVKVDHYEWKREPKRVLKTFPPAPPFSTTSTRRWVDEGHEWKLKVVADCGHTLASRIVAAEGDTLPLIGYLSLPIGKRKRCPYCPPPEKKPPPPDNERCTYDVADDRQCSTRARWQVTVLVDGGHPLSPGVWPLLCEKHRRYLVSEGYIVPVDAGGQDVVVPVPKRAPGCVE